jgi:hypothetical protein
MEGAPQHEQALRLPQADEARGEAFLDAKSLPSTFFPVLVTMLDTWGGVGSPSGQKQQLLGPLFCKVARTGFERTRVPLFKHFSKKKRVARTGFEPAPLARLEP